MNKYPDLSRRTVLAGLSALPFAAEAAAKASPASEQLPHKQTDLALNAIAVTGARRFGSAIASTPQLTDAGSIQNPSYAALVSAECGIVVPENEMKWQALRPSPAAFDFDRMDQIVRWAVAAGIAVRGHTLLWHRPEWFPEWLNTYDFGMTPVQEAERVLAEHIRTVTRRYKGVITSYDVVNEAIDHKRDELIVTSLSRSMGKPEDVMDLAFHVARDELPDAQLVYNDYMSWEPGHSGHCAAVLRLLEGFKRRGTPVDALGVQSHIRMFEIEPQTGVGPYREREWREFLDEVVGMGYRLLITEFDVNDKALPEDKHARDKAVAEYSRLYLELMMDYSDHLDDVLVWGMVDKFNWLQTLANPVRAGRSEVRGSPYDSQYQAKSLRGVFADALEMKSLPRQ
jgi:endo-1,4-beta-xylanase